MSVTLKDVEYIAELARLEFSDEEKKMLTSELNQILEYMEQLNQVKTDTIEPLSHVLDLSNVFREDLVQPGISTEEALKNAPSATEEFFRVPKVLGEK
ncbi:MAG: Asp-tRNA(Asn)/Glu-tRNA(Gln) amidotransferase subunit GatC [Bacteroidetes bacterium]|nr:Asp-tRNA(Asn)/Glu-tRNA(Gln) amidotransferase subunit GatC [Bacteroidota bacterium]